MPIVVSNEGWVKVAPKPRKPSKPVNPVNAFRGPLAYITGRPEFAEPVKKRSTADALALQRIEPPQVFNEKPRRARNREPPPPPPAPQSRHRSRGHAYEDADEEIPRPDLWPDDSQSRRSASPAGSRYSRAAPSVRSRRHDAPRSVYEDEVEDTGRHSRNKKHESTRSIYNEPKHSRSERHLSHHNDEPHSHHRSDRSYRDHPRDRYYSHSNHSFAGPMPQIQPIVIYATQPQTGCGGHYGCHANPHVQHQFYGAPMPLPASMARPGLPAPIATPSEVGSTSSKSTASRAMSYQWYTATQPLKM